MSGPFPHRPHTPAEHLERAAATLLDRAKLAFAKGQDDLRDASNRILRVLETLPPEPEHTGPVPR